MEYDNSGVRRQDRLLPHDSACLLLRNAEYGVLSMVDGNEPYAVPVSYAWDGQSSIYVHCAPEGRKLRCIAACSNVSFCVVGATQVLPDKFTTRYESIIAVCRATVVGGEEERRKAVRLILDKYSPHCADVGMTYAEKSLRRTTILRLDVVNWSGKAKL